MLQSQSNVVYNHSDQDQKPLSSLSATHPEHPNNKNNAKDIQFATPWPVIKGGGAAVGVVQVGLISTNSFDFTPHQASTSASPSGIAFSSPSPSPSPSPSSSSSSLKLSTIDMKQVTLEKEIGRGAFGRVFKGDWHGTDVAVKFITLKSPTMSDGDNLKLKESVIREVSIMQNVRHPNLVSLLGYDIAEEEVKIVMEYMEGGGLNRLVHDHKVELSWEEIKRFAVDICKGMCCLHKNDPPVIHRDLKSLNILVDGNRVVKVSDFGLGRTAGGSDSTLTNGLGTPVWMAPEVMSDEQYGLKADVYSFGIIMWELCCRRLPYEGLIPAKIVLGVVSGKLRPTTPSHIPSVWRKLMERCWDGDASSRPDFTEILKELKSMSLPSGNVPH